MVLMPYQAKNFMYLFEPQLKELTERAKTQAIRAMWVMITCSSVLFFSAFGQDQSSCPNSNFSLGNFTGWEGYYGTFWNPEAYSGFAPTRHTIIEAPVNFDLHTCSELNPVPVGEKYSLRLGNDNIGAEAEQIRYSVNVTEETSLFIYKYAVVLEDPNHDPEEQPNFTIEVADIYGHLIDSVCGFYYVYAHQGMPTWHSCGEVVWKDWTTVGIDLTQYIGQTISIKFTTRDCSQTGHFGYAYLSAYCSKVQLTFGFCPDDTIATVTAPPGFSYLWANGDTTQSTTIYDPVFGRIDSCVLTSVNGCKVTVTGTFQPTLINADFGYTQKNCVGASVPFQDSSTINQNTITNWTWDFGDGSPLVTNIQNPDYIYIKSGEFYTTLIVSSTDGCPDTITKMVEVFKIPEVNFSTNDPCGPNTFYDTIYFDQEVQLEVEQGYNHYLWNTGDSSSSILITDEGWYKVTIDNAETCYNSDSVAMLYCNVPLRMPNAFTPNSDGKNDLFRPVTQVEKITTFTMLIYDRWGENIIETHDIFQGWNGTIKGRPAPLGVYVYTVIYGNPSGITTFLKGTFTLVR